MFCCLSCLPYYVIAISSFSSESNLDLWAPTSRILILGFQLDQFAKILNSDDALLILSMTPKPHGHMYLYKAPHVSMLLASLQRRREHSFHRRELHIPA